MFLIFLLNILFGLLIEHTAYPATKKNYYIIILRKNIKKKKIIKLLKKSSSELFQYNN